MDDTPQHSRVGSRFGPYLIKRLIGRGGMGEVYEAEDTVKGRVVALKLLPDALSGDPVFRERLQREARSAGKLQEPHVVPVHDYGEIDGHLFVDMRLIDGIDLRTTLQRTGPMPPAQAVGLVRQIAAALDAAHDAGVMHRDVKPENILVTRDGFAYLVDFGIASAATDHTLTEKGTAIGTYAYMAPERFSSDPVTYRADIYALACVLHQCLTGSQPYRTDSLSMLITAHLIQPAPRPSQVRPGVPPAFDAVVEKGMAKRAEDRYASAGELARAAEAAVGPPDSSAYPGRGGRVRPTATTRPAAAAGHRGRGGAGGGRGPGGRRHVAGRPVTGQRIGDVGDTDDHPHRGARPTRADRDHRRADPPRTQAAQPGPRFGGMHAEQAVERCARGGRLRAGLDGRWARLGVLRVVR
ncbi:serine/threonine protein kinase [Mycolicibacterium holsaticum DSM 44478 = JCM 12374]|nr:serine/threonine protein kinase [Mycolicibacterium holsaticum DSM 44478 = JCM 12374]